MAKEKFTPGPWDWWFGRHGNHVALSGKGPNNYVLIASGDAVTHWVNINAADADLIAAAPDLLAACRMLKASMDDIPDFSRVFGGAEYEAVSAAIAKATGGKGQ